ncbi:Hypothetical predicted protein [Marmota monax]|nr:hypothetical protein GHT09_006346 [Marmota monax]VTJ59139.1 Hypothetical predicted protein [Marmota monax]
MGSAPSAARSQKPPSRGPPLTTRTGSAGYSPRQSGLHRAAQPRSAATPGPPANRRRDPPRPPKEQPMTVHRVRKLFRPDCVSTDAQESTRG